ncbi:MAG: formimidoylglutamase [Bacteroidota bacterium]
MNELKLYRPAEVQNWQGRASTPDQYIYQQIACVDLRQYQEDLTQTAVIIGYCCDAGVQRNQGRIGAESSPDAIRWQLARKANHLADTISLIDGGNLVGQNDNLEEVQLEMTEVVTHLLTEGAFPIVLGGGHDLAFAHGRGIYNWLQELPDSPRLGILNLDAHFDLRQPPNGRGNSGTPFYQLAQLMGPEAFNYFCLGIQRQANPAELFKQAEILGVDFVLAEQCGTKMDGHALPALVDWLEAVDLVYLTIDLDGFAAHYAPGVSAPSPFGFSPELAQEVISLLKQSGKLVSCDLVELNPKYDIDSRTARLAAGLITDLIYGA